MNWIPSAWRMTAPAIMLGTLALARPIPVPAQTAGELADRLITAFGSREQWAQATVDHITAVVEPPGGEPFLVDLFTRWDRPQTITWVRTRTREQVRVWDGTRGWTATRVYGRPAEVADWSPDRLAREQQAYKSQFERLIHRLAKRDPALELRVGEGARAGWLEVAEGGEALIWVLVGPEGNPEQVMQAGGGGPIRFTPLVSFGDHKQPGGGVGDGGERFTTYLARLRRSADGIRFARPENLHDLDPTR